MTGESLYPRLEPLLAQVQKPIQYVGGELNAQIKPWDDVLGGGQLHRDLHLGDGGEGGVGHARDPMRTPSSPRLVQEPCEGPGPRLRSGGGAGP